MPVMLDTTGMTPAQRAQAMEEFMSGESLPMRFDCSRPLADMHSWGALWELGCLQFLQARGAGMRGIRTGREVDRTPAPLLTVAYFAVGVTTGTRSGSGYVSRPGELMLLDLTEPFDMRWQDGHSAFALQLSQAELGATPAVARRAAYHAQASPVYDLVRRHIGRTCATLPSLQGKPAGKALAGVTVDLVRALVASAGAKPADAAEVLEETLPVRIERWIVEHLGEPSLSPDAIASAHFLSVRQLYYVWATRNGETPAPWIMSRRLERAARRLAAPGSRDVAIAAVARDCGFADPPHFARRFRERYGVAPRDWRAMHRAGVPPVKLLGEWGLETMATLLFDSATLPPAERYAAAQDVLLQSSHPTTLDPLNPAEAAGFQFRAWAMAPDGVMFTASGPALHLWRRENRNWHDEESLFALTTQPTGRAVMTQHDAGASVLVPGSLRLVDLGAAYDYAFCETGSSVTYQLTMESVGLRRPEIAAAAARLSASPLFGLVRDNLTDLAAHAQTGGPVYLELHQAMVDLTRALIVSVLPDEAPGSMPDSDVVLWAALRSHVRRHLHERSLDEASVAVSLGVEPGRLRRVAEAHGLELSDFIAARRVKAARAELARHPAGVLPARAALASTAARWGFTSPDTLLEAMAADPDGPRR